MRPQDRKFYLIVLLLLVSALSRNLLEMLGLFTKSDNYCCYMPELSSFLNTFSYTFLLVFFTAFLLHLWLSGSRKQLRSLISYSAWFMLPLFVMIPLLNLVFNYHWLKLPIWYKNPILIYDFYASVGVLVAFLVILTIFPLGVKRIYGNPLNEIMAKIFALFLFILLWVYQFGLWLADTMLPLGEGFTTFMNIYSWTFLLPVIVTFPYFIKRYFPKNEEMGGRIVFFGILSVFLSLTLYYLFKAI